MAPDLVGGFRRGGKNQWSREGGKRKRRKRERERIFRPFSGFGVESDGKREREGGEANEV